MNAQDRLADLLSHYFMTAFEAAGLPWDGEHHSEIGGIAKLIVAIAREEAFEAIRSTVPDEATR